MRRSPSFLFAGCLLLTMLATPSGAASDDAELAREIRNYTRVDDTVACAGATPVEMMPRLRAAGFRTVVNFRTEGESGADVEESKRAAEESGLRYVHLPFREPTAEIAESFLEVAADEDSGPLFVHCGSANRVGAMWLIKRVVVDGWSVEKATAEAEEIGLRSAGLKAFALDYVAKSSG